MAETKERKMSPKGFLAKTQTKAANSAIAFLAQYRDYLVTGELKDKTSPIIAQVDAGELLPTPALREIQYAVMAHIIESDSAKADKAAEPATKGTRKSWKASIYDAAGVLQTKINGKGEEEDLVQGFDLGQRANEWADRRLFEGTHGWYAMVEHTTLTNVFSRIERGDSMARVLKQPKGPAIHQKGKSTKTLGFGVKAKQTRVTFSGS